MDINHHGYLLTGDVEKAAKVALDMAGKILGVSFDPLRSEASKLRARETLRAHPDFSFSETTPFTIDEARSIRERSSKKSFSGKGRVFVIKTSAFTREAGNALLKTLEEPAGLSYFFIITSSSENILNTLRSRLVPITFYPDTELSKEKREFIEKFLSAFPEERMDMVKKVAEDKQKTLDFMNSLELFFREKLIKNFSKDIANLMDDIGYQRDFLRGRSSSQKMILEHLSLTLSRL